MQGVEFSINVADNLNDQSMDLGTSVVGFFFRSLLQKLDAFCLQHWHGLFQKHTNFVDGLAFITQCPLVPNESFLYQFNALDQAVNTFCMCPKMLN
jgi:iron transport multicopper oxidase